MDAIERRRRFRAILNNGECVSPASVFDAISVRIAEDLGFETAILAGSVASMAVLGAPDLVVLTLTELAAQAHRICRAANIPLLVDADHGYGNALNVMRTVQELETAGVAALTVEDTDLPQAFGSSKPRLVTIEEGVGKMRAALAARVDPNLVIVGRTSAPSLSSLEDGIARMRAYEAAGVDAMFFSGVATRADVRAIAAAAASPIILGGGGEELDDFRELAACGVRLRLQGHQPFLASVQAVFETLGALRKREPSAKLRTASPDLLRRATRAEDYALLRRDFLSASRPAEKD